MTFYINASQRDSVLRISHTLKQCILDHQEKWSELVFSPALEQTGLQVTVSDLLSVRN